MGRLFSYCCKFKVEAEINLKYLKVKGISLILNYPSNIESKVIAV